jgi:hypothetical protein
MLNNVLRPKGKLNNVEDIPYFSAIKRGKKKCNLNALTFNVSHPDVFIQYSNHQAV